MQKFHLYEHLKIAGHILFWLASTALILFFFYFNEERVHFDLEIMAKALVINTGFALGVYVNLYVLIPRFLKQKSYVFYVFWLIVLLTLASIFIQLLFIYPLHQVFGFNEQFNSFNTNLHSAYFFATFIYVAFTSLLKFVNDWIALQDLNLKLVKTEQQKLEAELKTLKGQLNPHFLFNSLNNIYSLALIKSEKVPGLILRLSDLMRHIIYESRENYISLEKEIDFVDNFVELQKIRASEQLQIRYDIKGKMPPAMIAPLLFEPFIDNAFKHGLPGSDKQDFIHISFDFGTPGWLKFRIENNFDTGENNSEKKDGGIGIANVKQRLQHLYPAEDYALEIEHKNQLYSVNLHLKLK